MKIKILQHHHNKYWWRYKINEWNYAPKQYDYVFKYLDFNKLDKDYYIYFNDKETGEWFYETYINIRWLDEIYNDSPEGYQWLKDNWRKGVFKLDIHYPDKQELKTIVNKVVNVELIRVK